MKIKFTLITLCCFVTLLSKINAQAPAIQWAKAFGGSGNDQGRSIKQTNDSGYIVFGFTGSNDGDVTNNHGNRDCWLVKLNKLGSLQWQKTFGGTGFEEATCVQQTFDSGYILGGYTTSNDGDVTSNHGFWDAWVVKLSSTGNIQWQKTFGGTDDDRCYSINQTKDSGYIFTGLTQSNNGDVTGNHGGADSWVVKLNKTGSLQWQKTLGGTNYDDGQSIQQTSDGGYIVAGQTNSNDGDVTGNHGGGDSWVVKISSIGSIQWQKTLGGTNNEYAANIQQTKDSGYIIAGQTNSNDGDITGNHGGGDSWIVKLSSIGTLQWQKALGGSATDLAYSIQQTTDSGYVVCGDTYSNNGDVTNNHGNYDWWIVKLDNTGNLQWQKTLGGTLEEEATSIQQTIDGGYIITGDTFSNDGDVTGNHGSGDFWVVKLAQTVLPLKLLSFNAILSKENIMLSWQTTTEINTSHFNIQRSINSRDFKEVGKVYAKGAGNYSFIDKDFSNTNTLYYRLEIIDKDGSKQYSNIQTINAKTQPANFDIFPNPAKEQIIIKGNFKELKITDNLGKTVISKLLDIRQTQTTVNISQLTKGIYFIQCITNDKTITEKLVVE